MRTSQRGRAVLPAGVDDVAAFPIDSLDRRIIQSAGIKHFDLAYEWRGAFQISVIRLFSVFGRLAAAGWLSCQNGTECQAEADVASVPVLIVCAVRRPAGSGDAVPTATPVHAVERCG